MTNNVIKKVYKNWVEYQIYWSAGAAGTGDVTWPSSSTNWHLAVFDWATGKLIKDWWAVPTVNNATLTVTQNGTSVWTFTANAISNVTIATTDTTYESKSAASGWTAVSLVTTGEKYTWNNKQNSLSTQTAYSAKWTTTKVPQITTNTLWQVTTITEKSIAFPVTSVNSNTWAVTVNEVPSTWTTGHVLTKTASWYWWAAPSGWISNVTTWTTTTVTWIWAGSETEYWNLSSTSDSVLYFTF